MDMVISALQRFSSRIQAGRSLQTAAAEKLAIGRNPRTRISTKAVKKLQELLQEQIAISGEVRRLVGGHVLDMAKLQKRIANVLKDMKQVHRGVANFLQFVRYQAVYESLLEYTDSLPGMDEAESSTTLASIHESLSHLDGINIFMRRHSIRVGLIPLGEGGIIILALVNNRDFYVELTQAMRKILVQGSAELQSSPVMEDLLNTMKSREKRDLQWLIGHIEGGMV